jgi:hypothetical protein
MNDHETFLVSLFALLGGFIWWLAFHADPTAPLHSSSTIIVVVVGIIVLTGLARLWPAMSGRK